MVEVGGQTQWYLLWKHIHDNYFYFTCWEWKYDPIQCTIGTKVESGQDIGIHIYYNWARASITSWKNKHGVSRHLPCTLSAFHSENHV